MGDNLITSHQVDCMSSALIPAEVVLTLSHFLAKVVYTPEFSNKNVLKFFTKLQPHSLKVSSKKKSFSM